MEELDDLVQHLAESLGEHGLERIGDEVLQREMLSSRLLLALKKKQMGSIVLFGVASVRPLVDGEVIATLEGFCGLVDSLRPRAAAIPGIRGGVFGILGVVVNDVAQERAEWLRGLKRRSIVKSRHVVTWVLDVPNGRVLGHRGPPWAFRWMRRLVETSVREASTRLER